MHPEADESFIEALWFMATNDGDAYRARDAKAAIRRAFAEYQRIQREREQEDFSLCRDRLIRDLEKRWEDK